MGPKSLFLVLLLAGVGYADTGFRDLIQVTETDGSPKCMAGQLKFGSGQVACSGNTATLTITGGAGGGSSSLESIFDPARSSPTATLKGNPADLRGSVSGSTMTISLSTNVARLDRNQAFTDHNAFSGGATISSMTVKGAASTAQTSIYQRFNGLSYDSVMDAYLPSALYSSYVVRASTHAVIGSVGQTTDRSQFSMSARAIGFSATRSTTELASGDAGSITLAPESIVTTLRSKVVTRLDRADENRAGSSRLYDNAGTQYVSIRSSDALTHTQEYVLPKSTATTDTVLSVQSINPDGTVGLYWKTDATGGTGGGDNLGSHVATMTVTIPAPYGLATSTLQITGGGTGVLTMTEGAAPSGVASSGVLYADSTAHWFSMKNNNGDAYKVVGSSTTPTAGKCASWSAAGSLIAAPDACGTGTGGGYATIIDESTSLTQRTSLKFTGAGVSCADDTDKTTCTIAGGSSSGVGYALEPATVTITAPAIVVSTLTVTSSMTIRNISTMTLSGAAIEVSTIALVAEIRFHDGTIQTTAGNDGSFGMTFDGGGSALSGGSTSYVEIPFTGTITGWTIYSDVSGSANIQLYKDTYANFPPTVADLISGTETPLLSAAQKNQDLALSTWTTAVTKGDIVSFVLNSASTATRVTVTVRVTKS